MQTPANASQPAPTHVKGTCKTCGKLCPAGRRSTCGEPACITERNRQRLAEYNGMRSQSRKARKHLVTCRRCPTQFYPYSKRHLDCSAACKQRSLELAIEGQRQRRVEAKKNRAAAKGAGACSTPTSTGGAIASAEVSGTVVSSVR